MLNVVSSIILNLQVLRATTPRCRAAGPILYAPPKQRSRAAEAANTPILYAPPSHPRG